MFSNLKKSKFLVTGGLGFIGSNFCNYLVNVKDVPIENIMILDIFSYASDIKNIHHPFEILKADISELTDDDLLKIQEFNPAFIVNFAAETHVDNSIKNNDPFIKTNIIGVNSIIKLTRSLDNCHLLHISTDEVYGDIDIYDDYEFDEEDILKPSNPYAASKAAGDLLIKANYRTFKDFTYNIVRPSNNYGPNQHTEKFLPTLIRSVLQNKKVPLYGAGLNMREWLYVEDTAKCIWNILELGEENEIYNIGDSVNRLHNIQVVELVSKLLKISKEDININIGLVTDRPGHDRKYALNDEKYVRLLNEYGMKKENTDYVDGFQATIHHYWGKFHVR